MASNRCGSTPAPSPANHTRHFLVAAHDGVLVDVITEIAPGPEYAAMFSPSDRAGSPVGVLP